MDLIQNLKKKPINHEQINPRNETSHIININKKSKLYKICKKDKIKVNSAHHQSIKKLGKNLLVSAIADDGGPAINYEIAKRQVQALSEVGAAENSKTIVIPTNITETLGTLATLFETVNRGDASSS